MKMGSALLTFSSPQAPVGTVTESVLNLVPEANAPLSLLVLTQLVLLNLWSPVTFLLLDGMSKSTEEGQECCIN